MKKITVWYKKWFTKSPKTDKALDIDVVKGWLNYSNDYNHLLNISVSSNGKKFINIVLSEGYVDQDIVYEV